MPCPSDTLDKFYIEITEQQTQRLNLPHGVHSLELVRTDEFLLEQDGRRVKLNFTVMQTLKTRRAKPPLPHMPS